MYPKVSKTLVHVILKLNCVVKVLVGQREIIEKYSVEIQLFISCFIKCSSLNVLCF